MLSIVPQEHRGTRGMTGRGNRLEIVGDFFPLRENPADWQSCLRAIVFMHEDRHVEFWRAVHRLMPVGKQKPVGLTQFQYLARGGPEAGRVIDNDIPLLALKNER